MYCFSCGKQLSNKAVVCPQCGCALRNISTGAIAAFYIGGAIVPLIGWAGAIYLLVKGKVIHAVIVTLLTLFMLYFWIAFFAAMDTW